MQRDYGTRYGSVAGGCDVNEVSTTVVLTLVVSINELSRER